MKLLLVTALLGAASALPQLPHGIKAFQYSHPGFVQTYNAFKEPSSTSSEEVEQPSVRTAGFTPLFTTDDDNSFQQGLKYLVPSIKAVGFTPLFTTDDDDDDDDDKEVVAVAVHELSEPAQTAGLGITDDIDSDKDAEPAKALTYSRNFAAVPSYAAAPTVYTVSGGVPAVGHVSTIPITQYSAGHAYTGGNLIYSSASPTVYSGPNVFSAPTVYSAPGVYNSHPFFYNSQSIAPAVTKLLTSPQHVASYVIRRDD